MKRNPIHLLGVTLLISLIGTGFIKNQSEPWRPDQLLEPKDLAAIINDSAATKPLIINIGPVGSIKGAVKVGPAKEKEYLNELKKLLSKEDHKRSVVIYCGCCPFDKCPNIRPAFGLLNKMKFTNHKLLGLQNNIKIDWIDKGFPMSK